MRYEVVIIGGGVSGLSCAVTLSSANARVPMLENSKYLIIDQANSDLTKAKLNNAPAITQGIEGSDALTLIRKQVIGYGVCDAVKDEAVSVENSGEFLKIQTASGKEYEAKRVVVASGFHSFDIKLPVEVELIDSKLSPRPDKVEIVHQNNKLAENIYVAGVLAGEYSMFATCAGSGVKVACDILSEIAGKNMIIHDLSPSAFK